MREICTSGSVGGRAVRRPAYPEGGIRGCRPKNLSVSPTERFFVACSTLKLLRMTGYVLSKAPIRGRSLKNLMRRRGRRIIPSASGGHCAKHLSVAQRRDASSRTQGRSSSA